MDLKVFNSPIPDKLGKELFKMRKEAANCPRQKKGKGKLCDADEEDEEVSLSSTIDTSTSTADLQDEEVSLSSTIDTSTSTADLQVYRELYVTRWVARALWDALEASKKRTKILEAKLEALSISAAAASKGRKVLDREEHAVSITRDADVEHAVPTTSDVDVEQAVPTDRDVDVEQANVDVEQAVPTAGDVDVDVKHGEGVPGFRRPVRRWAPSEVEALTEGVGVYGEGKWRAITLDPRFSASLLGRTPVDLKDKWRNLKKVR